jgi:hypothetical protein
MIGGNDLVSPGSYIEIIRKGERRIPMHRILQTDHNWQWRKI